MADHHSNSQSLDSKVSNPGDPTDRPQDFVPWFRRIASALTSTEAALGVTITGILVGLSLLLIAALYVTPAYVVINNGVNYSQIASNPLRSLHNPFTHRILSPLLAHYLGMTGPNFIFFPLLCSLLFLAAIYWHFRKLGYIQGGALIASSTMAFSSPILCLLHFQGYTDVLSHLLLFGCLVFRRSRVLWAILLALACLNHESAVFSVPWVLFLRTLYYKDRVLSWRGAVHLSADVFLAALAVLVMVTFRKLYPLVDPSLGHEAYLAIVSRNWLRIIRFGPLGVFMAFKAFWFLPIVALLTAERGSRVSTIILFALMFFAGAGQLIFGSDTSRHLGHAFPMILYSLEMLLKKKENTDGILQIMALLVVANFFVPQYYIGQEHAWPFLPSPLSLVLWAFGLDPWALSFAPWT